MPDRGRDDGRSPYSSNALLQLVRTHDTATRRSRPLSLPPVRRSHDLALRKMPRIRTTLQVSKVRVHGTIDDDDASTSHDQDIPLRRAGRYDSSEGEDSKSLGGKGLDIQVRGGAGRLRTSRSHRSRTDSRGGSRKDGRG